METEYSNRLNYLKGLQSKGDKRLGGVDIEALAKNKMLYNAFVQDRDGKYYDDYPKTANWTPADAPPPYKSFGQKVYDKLSPYFPSTIIGNRYDRMSDESKRHASNIKEGVGYFGRKINDEAKEVVRNSIKPYDDVLNAVDKLWQTPVTDMSKHPRIPSGEKQMQNSAIAEYVKDRAEEARRVFGLKNVYERRLPFDDYYDDMYIHTKTATIPNTIVGNTIPSIDKTKEMTPAQKDSIFNSGLQNRTKKINSKQLRRYLESKDITEDNYKYIE